MKKKLLSALLALAMLLPGAFAVDLYVDGSRAANRCAADDSERPHARAAARDF